jgi:DMSO/TMAO reductase YedYZ molybdopterin-dependent catalytic subunit
MRHIGKLALWGAFTGLAVVALTYLGFRLAGLPFVPFDLFDWLTRITPGALITFGIETMIKIITGLKLGPTASTAKLAENALAIIQFLVLGAIFGGVIAAFERRRPGRGVGFGIAAALVGWFATIFIEAFLGRLATGAVTSLVWLGAVYVGWGAILGRLARDSAPGQPATPESALSRRQFLYLVGAGSFTVIVSALGVSVFKAREATAGASAGTTGSLDLAAANQTSGPAASPPDQALAARFSPVEGTRPEVTSNQNFYRIDIDATPPQIDESTWRLELTGLVDKPLSLSLADLRAFPSVSQYVTLSCISNGIGGDLISTALFTGVPLKDILAEAGLHPEAKEIYIESVDGFYESVNTADMTDERTLLVYAMNGKPLPAAHGFPLRIYIPNRYGMKQPKWITRMEAIDYDGPGYWVDRGWSATAFPQTTSVIDAVAVEATDPKTGQVPVGGIAWAGDRGISKVEIEVDDGPWEAAELRSPALSPLTWVQWRYFWAAPIGKHTVRVRAYDGKGVLQVTREAPAHPNGATGIDSVTAVITE